MLTNEIIDEHVALWEKYIGLKELNSENIKTIQDQHGEDNVEVMDPETKEWVTVREKDLWQETKYLGFGDNRAGNYFRSKYPDIFERDKKIVELGKEIAKFEVKHFGFKLNEMTPPAMIQLIQALISKELDERNEESAEFFKDPAKFVNEMIRDYSAEGIEIGAKKIEKEAE